MPNIVRGARSGKVPKAWAMAIFWVSIRFYKKHLVKKIWSTILGLARLKFAMAAYLQKIILHDKHQVFANFDEAAKVYKASFDAILIMEDC